MKIKHLLVKNIIMNQLNNLLRIKKNLKSLKKGNMIKGVKNYLKLSLISLSSAVASSNALSMSFLLKLY